jgi:uncharacterized membrane protein
VWLWCTSWTIMAAWEEYLERWVRAGVIDARTADRVRALENENQAPAGQRWQVAVVLALGMILLVGGMMLFVASHWDDVNPWQRLALVMGFLVAFHALAVVSANRFPGMATTLHGVGTAGAGAAILTVGQIFNMQEHWPTAVLVWAACAGAGWLLLRDQVQEVMTWLLVPTWVVCEWSYRAEGYAHSTLYSARMCAVLAVVMLTCFLRSKKPGVFWTLYVVGATSLMSSIAVLSDGWTMQWMETAMVPVELRATCALVIVVTLAGVWWWRRSSVVPVAMVAAVSYALPWIPKDVVLKSEYGLQPWKHVGPGLLMYGVVVMACAGLVWWGLRMRSRAVVNFGIGGFAATVLWFYLSSLLDKLGRSLGLIGLGFVFLAGGWALERLRRRLMSELKEDAV